MGREALVVKTLAAFADNQSLVPNTHIGWLSTAYNTQSRGLDIIFSPAWPFL